MKRSVRSLALLLGSSGFVACWLLAGWFIPAPAFAQSPKGAGAPGTRKGSPSSAPASAEGAKPASAPATAPAKSPASTPANSNAPTASSKETPAEEAARMALTQQEDAFAQALAHFSVGVLAETMRDMDGALEEYIKVLELDPSRQEIAVKVGAELLRRHENQRAIDLLQKVSKSDPKNYAVLIMLSVALRSEQRWDDSIAAARQAQKADPQKISPYQAMMEVYLETAKPKLALETLNLAAKQNVSDYRYWVQLGQLFALLNSREPTLKISAETLSQPFEKALALNPEEPEVIVQLADHFRDVKDLKRAIELYLKVLEKNPDAIDIYQKLALSYVQDGDKRLAISTLQEVVKKEPLKYQIHNLIGELEESLKDWKAAKLSYESSLIINPDQLENYLKVSLLNLRLKDTTATFETLKKAKEKFPNLPQVPYFYGLAYSESKDYPKAVSSFEEAYLLAQSNPSFKLESDFYFYYGAACERNGEFERSVELFKKAIELNPDYADAYNYLGFMYADKGVHLDESLQLIQKAVSYEPENGAFVDSLGWIYYKLGQYDKALTELEKAVRLIKDEDSVVYEHLGDVYQKIGKRDQAVTQYRKAFQQDPSNQGVLKKLKDLQAPVPNAPAPSATNGPAPAPLPSPAGINVPASVTNGVARAIGE